MYYGTIVLHILTKTGALQQPDGGMNREIAIAATIPRHAHAHAPVATMDDMVC
jgi:hypothetical protein